MMKLVNNNFIRIFLVFALIYLSPGVAVGRCINNVVLIDNFDHGVMYNMFGGKTQGDEELDGGCIPSFAGADSVVFGNLRSSLRLDYDVSFPGTFSFYTSRLGFGGADLSAFEYLSFWFYPTRKNMDFCIEVHQDTNFDSTFTFGLDHVDKLFMGRFTRQAVPGKWQKIVVPLRFFRNMTAWNNIFELVFLFENSRKSGAGTMYIDDIVLGTCYPSAEELNNIPFSKSVKIEKFLINDRAVSGPQELHSENSLLVKMHDFSGRLESLFVEGRVGDDQRWLSLHVFYGKESDLYAADFKCMDKNVFSEIRVRAVSSVGEIFEQYF